MKEKIPAKNIFISDNDWNIGRYHFPFADYEDPQNNPFGVLQALNDFELKPGTGFETHPHDEMEIISYCVEGTLEHVDSTGQKTRSTVEMCSIYALDLVLPTAKEML